MRRWCAVGRSCAAVAEAEADDDANDDDDDACVDCELATCGDGVIHAGQEACDGMALGGQTCVALGHTGGTLDCSGQCEFDESMCTDEPMMPM